MRSGLRCCLQRFNRDISTVSRAMTALERQARGGSFAHYSATKMQLCKPHPKSAQYGKQMHKHGLVASMSRRGDCFDNAVAESFFSNLKNELVHDSDFASRASARGAIFEYIEVFYNRQRSHQSLDCLSPVAFEQHHGVA
jgi:transposase InsO family protein